MLLIQVHENIKLIESHRNVSPKLLNHLLESIQFSSRILTLSKGDSYTITVRWTLISGYQLSLKANKKKYNDNILFPSRMQLVSILNNIVDLNSSSLKEEDWVISGRLSKKKYVELLIIVGQILSVILTFVFFGLSLIAGNDDKILASLALISLGSFWVLINFKSHFYHRDSLLYWGNLMNSPSNIKYVGYAIIMLGSFLLIAGILET